MPPEHMLPHKLIQEGAAVEGQPAMGPSLQLSMTGNFRIFTIWEFRFPYELRLTYLKRYVKRSRHGTDGRTDGQTDGQHQHMMGPPSRKDGPIKTSTFLYSSDKQ